MLAWNVHNYVNGGGTALVRNLLEKSDSCGLLIWSILHKADDRRSGETTDEQDSTRQPIFLLGAAVGERPELAVFLMRSE